MNFGLREVDTAFKDLLKAIYSEGIPVRHNSPDTDWEKEVYPCVTYDSNIIGSAEKDYNSYLLDDTHITDSPDYLKISLRVMLITTKVQDMNTLVEMWLLNNGTGITTLDVTGKDSTQKTFYLESPSGFVSSNFKSNGKNMYRKVQTYTISVPVEKKAQEYAKVNNVHIIKKEV